MAKIKDFFKLLCAGLGVLLVFFTIVGLIAGGSSEQPKVTQTVGVQTKTLPVVKKNDGVKEQADLEQNKLEQTQLKEEKEIELHTILRAEAMKALLPKDFQYFTFLDAKANKNIITISGIQNRSLKKSALNIEQKNTIVKSIIMNGFCAGDVDKKMILIFEVDGLDEVIVTHKTCSEQ